MVQRTDALEQRAEAGILQSAMAVAVPGYLLYAADTLLLPYLASSPVVLAAQLAVLVYLVAAAPLANLTDALLLLLAEHAYPLGEVLAVEGRQARVVRAWLGRQGGLVVEDVQTGGRPGRLPAQLPGRLPARSRARTPVHQLPCNGWQRQ